MAAAFATIEDVELLGGKTLTTVERERVEALLPMISDLLRGKASDCGRDIDAMIEKDAAYGSRVKLVTVDVVIRVLRQDVSGEPMAQESQAGLGYSWSGTYAIPGGGIANAVMRNDLKTLGLLRQRIGALDIYGTETEGRNRYFDREDADGD